MILSWFLDHIPWWVIPSLGGVLLLVAFIALRAFGLTAKQTWAIVYAAGAAILAATLYQKGRRSGVQSVEERQRRDDEKLVRTRDEIVDAVEHRTDEENRERLKQWGRKK